MDASPQVSANEQLERNLFRKISWRLMPLLLLGYFISFIDRANVGVMYTPLTKALGLTPSGFGLAAGLFYIGYLLFEIPSNVAITKYGARVWLSRILITWGLVTVALAASQGAKSFYVLRILLGVAEAGFYPGVLFYLTLWYPKRSLHRAYSIFEVCVPIALAAGSIVTSGLLLLDGARGFAGWQWVFVLEGVPAVALGFYMFKYMPARPQDARWLTPDEAKFINQQVAVPVERHESETTLLLKIAKDGLSWVFSALYFSFVIAFWSVTYFLPKIVQERFHVGAVDAGLISAIPWVAAVAVILIVSKTSSRTGDRRWHMLVLLCAAGLGLFLSAYVQSPVIALIGLCLGAAGMQGAVPLFWTMPSLVFQGAMNAIALAMVNSLGNLSGLAGPWILGLLTELTGNSRAGLYVMSGFFFFSAFLAFAVSTSITRKHERRQSTQPGEVLGVS
ncbi:MFS transporter [Burkholderia sp. SCN-KJ]|uniref:MFS transporter n=1 Tax=Burkholderia sp. SCN-KJ TaxID=2969248 RepID=UPI00214F9D3A|nr:MFS transporter [Burkholderia sp. SCN-KJ]MCR4470432.1 MFS transporter [Burkholderia sp. SCN-KJ]